jgi:hypothetical protein
MLRKLLIIAATAASAAAVRKKLRDQRAEQSLWSEATDDVRSAPNR